MARDFIPINRTAIKAPVLLATVAAGRDFFDQLTRCLGVMSHLNDGTVFTDIETQFGLPGGTGQSVFNLINGALGSMKGTFQVADAQTLTEKLG